MIAEDPEEVSADTSEEADTAEETEVISEEPAAEQPTEETAVPEDVAESTAYTASFVRDEGVAAIYVYYTKDYSSPSVTDAYSAVARDSDTGAVDVSGSGQVNFTVVLAEGYSLANVSVVGGYKNLKDSADTGVENTFRITKVTGDLVVTITTAQGEIEQSDPYSYSVTENGIVDSS